MNILIEVIKSVLQIAGSLALFLFGMKMLGDGLQRAAGNKLKQVLKMMTGNRFKAILTGVFVTAIIQSSSATTVMLVSFVNAGLLTLTQSVGVIFGANIGTTVTGWIVALLGFKFSLASIAIPCVGLGFPLLFNKRIKLRYYGDMLIGFGLLFLGLGMLKSAMPDLGNSQATINILKHLSNPSFFVIIGCVLSGTIFTILVQSSSATMAIVLTMAFSGYLGPVSAAAMVLGQNIGTTITAYLASIGTNTNARRAAWAHILFNVIGTVIALILFMPLMHLVNLITYQDIFSVSGEQLRTELPTFLAMFHTVFNILNTLIFIPFINPFCNLICKLVKVRKSESDKSYHFEYLSSSYNDTPELYLLTVGQEIEKLGNIAKYMLDQYTTTFYDEKVDIRDISFKLKEKEDYADQMQEQLSEFIVRLMQDTSHVVANASELTNYLRIIDEFESITDSCFNLICMSERKQSDDLIFKGEEKKILELYHQRVEQFLGFTISLLRKGCSDSDLAKAKKLEDEIDAMRLEFRDRATSKLITGEAQFKNELLLLDLVRHLEHIGDYCLNIVESIHYGHKKITHHIIEK